MYFSNIQIVFQEVPDEISLAFSISGCNLKCKSCHSKETWNPYYGNFLNEIDFEKKIKKYKNMISCVLFYGGEWNKNLINYILIAKKENFKIALYTGLELDSITEEIKINLNYIKTGRYIEDLGGLRNKNTNQNFYILENGKIKEKINYKFQEKEDD